LSRRRIRGLGFGLLLLFAAFIAWIAWPVAIPSPLSSVRVLDRDGLLIAERAPPDRARGTWIDPLPQPFVDALVAAEDHRYYQHPGVDPLAIGRAALADLRAGRVVQGGSTLTQQLVRTLWERPPGLRGKLWEAAWALRLERHLDKRRILVEYGNRVYFGNLAYGVEAASRAYLDKPASALSSAEAALLVALIRRPGQLDPWRDPDAAKVARDRVIGRMEAVGSLSAEDAALARDEALAPRRGSSFSAAPHFVRRVLPELAGRAALEPGDQPTSRVIRTTLDLGLQQEVEALVRQTINRLASRGATQAAALVVDRRTAEVLAYVGSAGWNQPDGQVDGVMAPRSPGSALKPLLYWLGLEAGARNSPRGITLASILPDLPGSWTTTHGTWSPQNYDRRFHGPVTARYALARSLNLPAVRLLEQVGVAELHRRLQDLGVSTLTDRPDHYGLGLVLGGGEVRLDELTAAYEALASGGRARPLTLRHGPPAESRQVGDARAAWLVLDALDDPAARAASFGSESVLEADFPLSAKTGTSVGWRDNWAMGVTPEVVVGVWVGNFDGSPMVDVSGITGAGPLLRDIAETAHDRARGEARRPEGLEKVRVCPLSGLLPGERCPGARVEWFVKGTAPTTRCDWHREVEVDANGALATGCPGASRRLVVAWPPEYASWAAETGQIRWPDVDRSCASGGDAPTVTRAGIAWPPDGVAFYLDPRDPAENQAIPLRAAAPAGARSAEWRVDGQTVATLGPPFSARWVPSPGDHRVSLRLDGQDTPAVRIWVGGGAP